ncbi:N-acetylmuramoyl-L-alanine amidase [Hoeflea marina]|uniref:N-acetylmuramoyl-L-alanine amidase n=1 Tax=Hoeflea marina TaxID=274592 RepID=A0A317PMZ2_9HYPH|nr:N-acetylmuramoyl-L-alanine amidase [Hoeflea marina]PWW02136.1 N-acetylmuramoyl-L-alanine amidase [Hoeflea marina]
MLIHSHRLFAEGGAPVRFLQATHQGGTIRPRFLIMHYTAGGSAEATARYFAGSAARASAHLVIGRDGEIIQQVAFDRAAWHAGKSRWAGVTGLNSCSIGIELANWGLLSSGPKGHCSWTGAAVEPERVIFAAHRHTPERQQAWEIFPAPQWQAAVAAAQAIVAVYGIGEAGILGHDDIAPGRKIDPGPGFALDRFRAEVTGRGGDGAEEPEIFTVRSPSGLNLRSGPGLYHPARKLLADGARVQVIERQGQWWLVSEIVDGRADASGYVHSHWLQAG